MPHLDLPASLTVPLFRPSEFNIAAGAQPLIELARVVLDMANGDKLQFKFVNAKLLESGRGLEVQDGDPSGYLLFDMGQVAEYIFLESGAMLVGLPWPSQRTKSFRVGCR